MLKNLSYLIAALLLFGFSSCADETFDPVLRVGDAATLTNPEDGAAFIITEENLDEDMATFGWNAADFGVPTGVNYTLEADLAGNEFADPIRLVPIATSTSATVVNSVVNGFLISREIEAGTPTQVEVRVRALVGNEEDGNMTTSDVITLVVTPFAAARVYPTYYVPGEYQNWTPSADDVGRIFSVEDNGVYSGFVNFGDTGSPYKITDQPNWDNGIFGVSDEEGVLTSPGDNIVSPGSGYHLLEFDVNQLSFSQTATNWGLIGNATSTGWDSDTDLELDPATGLLSITTDLATGEDLGFKFRANDAWDIDLGDNGANGSLEFGGDNLSVAEAGNYTIVVDLTQAIPTYTLTKN